MKRLQIGFDNSERSALHRHEAEGMIHGVPANAGQHSHVVEMGKGLVLVITSVYANNTRCHTVYQGFCYERTYYNYCPLTLRGINEIATRFMTEVCSARS